MSAQDRKPYASTVEEMSREDEEQLFFFRIYAEPEPDNPESEKYGGAYVTGWVDTGTLLGAESALLKAIEQNGWRAIRLEYYNLVYLRDYSPSDYDKEELTKFAEYFEEAREGGLSMTFHTFPNEEDNEDSAEESEGYSYVDGQGRIATDEAYPKAYVDGYEPEPFWFEETFGNDGQTRLVVYTQNLDQLKWLVETVIAGSGELIDVMLKVQGQDDNGSPVWRRWMGRTDRKTVEDTFEKFSTYFLEDGGHQFLVRDAAVGAYFALDEHGVLYLYGGWQRFEDKLGEMGFENREDELITAQGHWHIELADTESLRKCVIDGLGLVEQ